MKAYLQPGIIKLHNSGLPLHRIAAELKCSVRTVAKYLAVANIPRRRRPYLLHFDPAQIAEAYQSGKGLEQIAEAFGCCTATVVRYLKLAGVPRRRRGPSGHQRPDYEERLNAMVELRQLGETLEGIAQVFGYTREYVRQCLKKRGLTGYLPKPPEPLFPIKHFQAAMHNYLYAAGYRFCSQCKPGARTWKCATEFSPKSRHLCRACNTTRQRSAYWASYPAMRDKQTEWVRKNPDKMREYCRRWREKRLGQGNVIQAIGLARM